MTRIALALVGVLLLSTATVPGVAAGIDPHFEAHVGQSVVAPGQTAELAVTLQNDAEDPEDRVDPAHDVQATMTAGDTPFTVTSGTRVLGTVSDGHPIRTTFAISVPQDVDAGTYHLPIEVTYEHDHDERDTETVYATVRVADRAHFQVVETTSSVPVGGDGPVSVTVENVGTEPATDATLQLTSKAKSVHFDGSPSSSQYVGAWAPGERRTLTYTATASPTTDARPYPLTARVAYDDVDGNRRHSAPLAATISPVEHAFDVEPTRSTVQVAGDGTASIAVTNTGETAVEGVSLEVIGTGPMLSSTQVTYPLGHLGPGESAEARVPIAVSPTADPGPREITTRVTYEDGEGDRVIGENRTTVIAVAPEQSVSLAVESNTLRVDREGDLTVRVTNTGELPVRNGNLQITGTAPAVHPEQREYAIGDLDPGQTTTVTYSVDVGDGATATPRTMTFAMAYDDAEGDRRTAKPQTLKIDIAERTPLFDVAVEEGSVPAGDSGAVTITVRNTGEETLSGIDAKAFTDSRLTVTDDSAYVARLGPGESTELTFGVAAPGDAQLKDYPLSVDFQYTDADGETQLTDTYDVPVRVTESEGLIDAVLGFISRLLPADSVPAGSAATLGVTGLLFSTTGLWRRHRDDA